MKTKLLLVMAVLGLSALAWADPEVPGGGGGTQVLHAPPPGPPTYQVDTKIVREYEENGESKRVEFTPNLRFSTGPNGQLQFNDQTIPVPNLPDENAQKAFSAMMQMFTAQVAPLMSQFSKGQPFQMILEVPTLHEKLNIEMTPHRDE